MTRQMIRFVAAAVASGWLLIPAVFAQEKPKPEQYSFVWMLTGGAGGGSSMSLDLHINKYNTEDDIKKFADTLVEGGPDRLRRALEKEDVGQLSPTGRVGTPVAIARKLVKANKTIIRAVTARNLPFLELRYSGRSVDYPFTIIELDLNEKGEGTGTAIAAAKITFNKKKNLYEIESYQHGTAYNKLMNVRRQR